MLKNKNRYFWLLLVVLTLAPVINIYADGSKDWAGAGGRRAFLRASTGSTENWPFANNGIHYVYAKKNERITMASSLQAVGGTARIRLYGPDGNQITTLSFSAGGRIENRAQEMAGPRLFGQAAGGNRYIPVYYQIPNNDAAEGIYRVEFLSSGTNISGTLDASVDWSTSQTPTSSVVTIAAWDVSVINADNNGFISGRVYTNMLNLSLGTDSPNSTGFYGLVYVRTYDGYTYRVNNNGNNGMYFTFFVNNNGFVDETTQEPLYTSLNNSTLNDRTVGNIFYKGIKDNVHNPNNADAGTHITHKLFYTLPAKDLPATATIATTANNGATWTGGQTTWVKKTPLDPTISDLVLIGADGSSNQVSIKGGTIRFKANQDGNFKIEIVNNTTSSVIRTLTGHAYGGNRLNEVYWDGKDENGNFINQGDASLNVAVQLQGAEVHFPFFDMEYNRLGTIIQLLDKNKLLLPIPLIDPISSIVYWNDTPVRTVTNGSMPSPVNNSHLPPANSAGINSTINGHIWGVGGSGTSGQFGDEKSIDTWTFIIGPKKEEDFAIKVLEADLEIKSVTTYDPGTTTEKTNFLVGDQFDYEVVVKNNGPDAVSNSRFTFRLPPGFIPVPDADFDPKLHFSTTCAIHDMELTYDSVANAYWSKLSLPDDCEITYTFRVEITDDSDPTKTEAVAGILRPHDVTDPNSTNRSNASKPIFKPDPSGPELTPEQWDELWKNPDSSLRPDPTGSDVDDYYIPPFCAEFECATRPPSPDPCNNVGKKNVSLKPQSDLKMEKTLLTPTSPPLVVGDNVTFQLKVTNLGPHLAKEVVVKDSVPSGYDIVDRGGGTLSGTNKIVWNLGDMPKGDIRTLTVVLKIKSTGSYDNVATVTGDVNDPDLTNNKDTETIGNIKNYWIGGKVGAPNDWDQIENWTGLRVPGDNEDIEFATEANNGVYDAGIPNSGPARENLHLGEGDGTTERRIKDLINASDQDLWITTGDQLTITGEVKDGDPSAGTIVVKSSKDAPTGTLKFGDPAKNASVGATVEFYNQAYDCQTCGFYTKAWQYFGSPVQSSEFPFQPTTPASELVNRWDETVNGNKWRPVTDENLVPFRGYQITNTDKTAAPDHIYDFVGTLNVGDKTIGLTRTITPVVVNYAGANLLSNSYTAAIPISPTAITFTNTEETVYLFNTGTRDEWRKLDGTEYKLDGYKGGQYLAVPVNLGGTLHFPDRIPSMHSFMVLVKSGTTGSVDLKYDKLTKNTKVRLGDGTTSDPDGTLIVTRSAGSASASGIPSLVMEVIGSASADRVWIFAKEGTTYGFDNGWDGRKISESGIAQLYVADDIGKDQFQVATMPALDNVPLGFTADEDGKYTIEYALSDHWKMEEIYLHDLATGTQTRVVNGGSYTFEAKKGDSGLRFRLSTSGSNIPVDEEAAKIAVNTTENGTIAISNNSSNDCTVFISNTAGRILQKLEVKARSETLVENISRGTYVVRLQNAVVNDARKVVME